MTGLDLALAAIFAAVWGLPIGMAVRWERRLRVASRSSPDLLASSSPASASPRRSTKLDT